ncbi:MAG: regulatory protein RecX [Clostridia bacterium]|nr:regulatory protein RecX [Clostridia bacterium]
MKIKSITKQKGHLVKIDLGDCEILLDSDFAYEMCLRAGNDLTDAEIEKLLFESDYRRAKSRALWFLDRADRSEKVLLQKVTANGIKKEPAIRAIERLKELGLVDDTRYARNLFAKYCEQNVSKRAAYAKMYEKGVPTDIIKSVINESETDEEKQILSLIERKYKTKITASDGPQKVAAALIRKGFSYSDVKSAIKKYTSIELIEE